MEKEITIKEFCDELVTRIDKSRDIACCKDEIRKLAQIAGANIGDQKITVHWKE